MRAMYTGPETIKAIAISAYPADCPKCGSTDLAPVGIVMPVSRCNGCGGLVVTTAEGTGYVKSS